MATAPPELWTFVLAPVCRPSELHLWVAFALWAAKALELHLLRFWLAIRLPRLKTTGAVPPARARPEGCSGQSGEHSKTGKGMPFVHTDVGLGKTLLIKLREVRTIVGCRYEQPGVVRDTLQSIYNQFRYIVMQSK